MTTHHDRPRPFLDVTEAETTADLGELRDSLREVARDAERLGLPDVKEHVEAALAHAVEQHKGEEGA